MLAPKLLTSLRFIRLAPISKPKSVNRFLKTNPLCVVHQLRSIHVDPESTTEQPPVSSESDDFKDSELFGKFSGRPYHSYQMDPIEEASEEQEKYRPVIPRKMKFQAGQYADMIKNYVSTGDLQAAQDVLLLMKRNGDKPDEYHFNLLINGFANHGDMSICFNLFHTMQRKKLKIKPNTIVSLYNSIANHPDKSKAEVYMGKMNKWVRDNSYKLLKQHYNVMIKAYGRHHMIQEAFATADLMLDQKMPIGISTINSLMYAAITDKQSGLKHVIRTWQLLMRYRIPPNVITYNLVLRAIRDCKFGSCSPTDLLLEDVGEGNAAQVPSKFVIDENRPDLMTFPPTLSFLPLQKTMKIQPLLTSGDEKMDQKQKPSSEVVPFNPEMVDLDAILRQNKLILFGGFNTFMNRMTATFVKPDIKTMTYMIELVPDSNAAENIVLKYAESNKILFDIDFFNMLIKKRSSRGDKESAKLVIDNIHAAGLKPNIMTYGVLALACSSTNDGRELLETLKFTGLSTNKYIIDTLLTSAMKRYNFGYVLELMEIALKDKLRLDVMTFQKLDTFQNRMTRLVNEKFYITKQEAFKEGFRKFNLRYKKWQQLMGREETEKLKARQ